MKKYFLITFISSILILLTTYKMYMYEYKNKLLIPVKYELKNKERLLIETKEKNVNLIIGDSRTSYLNTKYISNKTNDFYYNYSVSGNNYMTAYFMLKSILEKNINIKKIYMHELSPVHENFNDSTFIYSNILNINDKELLFDELNYHTLDQLKYNIQEFSFKYLNTDIKNLINKAYYQHKNKNNLKEYFHSEDNKKYGYTVYNFSKKSFNEIKLENDIYIERIFSLYHEKLNKLIKDNNIELIEFKSPVIGNGNDDILYVSSEFSSDGIHINHDKHDLYNEWFFRKVIK